MGTQNKGGSRTKYGGDKDAIISTRGFTVLIFVL